VDALPISFDSEVGLKTWWQASGDRRQIDSQVDWSSLPGVLVTHCLDDYKYQLRFRMCMREIKKIAEYVDYSTRNPYGWVPGTPYKPRLRMDGAPWKKWNRIQGPGFELRESWHGFWRSIGPHGWRSWEGSDTGL